MGRLLILFKIWNLRRKAREAMQIHYFLMDAFDGDQKKADIYSGGLYTATENEYDMYKDEIKRLRGL